MSSIFSKLEKLDHRYIYVLVLLALIVPSIAPVGLPVQVTPGTKAVYDQIQNLPAGASVLFAFDALAGMFPELAPPATALLQHLMTKSAKVFVIAFYDQDGPMGVENFVRPNVDMAGKVYGSDYVNLGFYPGGDVSMAAFASDVQKLVTKDIFSAPVSSIPMMQGIKTIKDFDLVVVIAGEIALYLRQFQAPYGTKIVGATQAIVYPELTPYVGSGQLLGLMNGLKASGEYETLIGKFGAGVKSSDALSVSQLLVIAFIAIGNIGYFYDRSRRSKEMR